MVGPQRPDGRITLELLHADVVGRAADGREPRDEVPDAGHARPRRFDVLLCFPFVDVSRFHQTMLLRAGYYKAPKP